MADEKQTFNLEDHTIAQIAKCLQVAILTGTDIADNLRQLELYNDLQEHTLKMTKLLEKECETRHD